MTVGFGESIGGFSHVQPYRLKVTHGVSSQVISHNGSEGRIYIMSAVPCLLIVKGERIGGGFAISHERREHNYIISDPSTLHCDMFVEVQLVYRLHGFAHTWRFLDSCDMLLNSTDWGFNPPL